tara:strand:- start:2214 stop:2531 length:318 start_codon:yes stop_codon:yes gene_type:complete
MFRKSPEESKSEMAEAPAREKRYPRTIIGGGRSSMSATISRGNSMVCFDGQVKITNKEGLVNVYQGRNGYFDEGVPVIDGVPVTENDPRKVAAEDVQPFTFGKRP